MNQSFLNGRFDAMRPSLHIQDFAVTERRLIDKFIKVPWRIYHDDPAWVPPLIHERKNLLSAKHPYFAHATARFWLAEMDGRLAGRISAQVDRIKARTDRDEVGYFGMFECINDINVSNRLFECAESCVSWFAVRLIYRLTRKAACW